MANRPTFGSIPDLSPAPDLKPGDKIYIIVPHLESTAPDPWKIIRAVVNKIETPTQRRTYPAYRLEPDRELLKFQNLAFNGRLPVFSRMYVYRYEDEAESNKVALSRFAPEKLIPLALPSNKKRNLKYMGGIGVFNLH